MSRTIEAYPLTWPIAYPRTKEPKSSQFVTTLAVARDEAIREISLLGGRDIIISSNIPLRKDGLPRATFNIGKIKDVGVAVYFTYQKEQVVFACDKWDKVEDNMQAIRKTIEALRGLDRWGVSDMLKRAFTGFKALPEKGTGTHWYEVLEVLPTATIEEIQTAWRKKAIAAHPDHGGTTEQLQIVNEAKQQALAARQ